MRFIKILRVCKFFFLTRLFPLISSGWKEQRLESFVSIHLGRSICIDIFLPPKYGRNEKKYPVLLFNDGQDMEAVQMKKHLSNGLKAKVIDPIIVVAIHAGDRMEEYGTIGRPDYQKRGAKADAYGRFITEELIPCLQQRYHCGVTPETWAIAGFSLGGLSAFDLAWNYPQYFSRVGVFSGSFWWRSKAFKENDPDADRIVHKVVREGPHRGGLRFWLQTGTHDETADRNQNGVIDAIDDTLDLIKELEQLGYQQGRDIQYVEIEGGEHNPETWGRVMPKFLAWLDYS